MRRPIDRVAARQELVERGHIGGHVAIGRGNDAGRPAHHMIAAEQDAGIGESKAQMVRGMAGRMHRLEAPFAARFAAKEAGAKALGTGISHGVSWLEIEIVREPSGRPNLHFRGRAAQIATRLGVAHAALSITHTAELAMASVLLEDGG